MNDTIKRLKVDLMLVGGERLMTDTIKLLKVDLMLIGGNA